ncbi:MAG: hypothetical protein ACXWUK_10250, partial [Burkholderiales bacterium]
MSSTDPTNYKVGIVYSATTASNYWSEMAYSQLFMAVQSQAAMAGVPYDILSEGDLAEVSRLVEYDALVFPGFRNVRAADLAAIEDALTEASQAHGVGIIAAGDFMTNDENGVDLPDAYSR